MSGHTPGPWIAAAFPSSIVGLPVVAQNGRSIASVTFFKLGPEFSQHDRESQSNARLISAAPDLLEALKYAAVHLEYAGFDMSKIDTAIAKAEGRQP